MPIDIKEIHVKVAIDQASNSSGQQNAANRGSAINKEAIIAECVEEVMQILKMKSER